MEAGAMLEEHLDNVLSSTIARIRRINYVEPAGHFNPTEGPVEFTFDGGFTIRLESGADGESLRISVDEWVDPFAEPLSAENRKFIEASGKRTAFDVSEFEGYKLLIGQRVENFSLITRMSKIVGVRLAIGPATLAAEVGADELLVQLRVGHG
ncbi:hypothetical protein ACIA5C_48390 [Actinoplanes sp. NPDC051343]|uniref:hypothetical protein n=1 Tax=Actinoplanes sp. NPDC051343 TaxID=3363906 RepID=UPI0037B11D05